MDEEDPRRYTKAERLSFACAGCGYGICLPPARLPRCPMCGLRSWSREGRLWQHGAEEDGGAGRPASQRGELHSWYAAQLRPKLARAARSGAIAPVRAAELERQMLALLAPRDNGRRDA